MKLHCHWNWSVNWCKLFTVLVDHFNWNQVQMYITIFKITWNKIWSVWNFLQTFAIYLFEIQILITCRWKWIFWYCPSTSEESGARESKEKETKIGEKKTNDMRRVGQIHKCMNTSKFWSWITQWSNRE